MAQEINIQALCINLNKTNSIEDTLNENELKESPSTETINKLHREMGKGKIYILSELII